ncbi:hypothetical protein BsWGS_23908 [Bradybaena similaris]
MSQQVWHLVMDFVDTATTSQLKYDYCLDSTIAVGVLLLRLFVTLSGRSESFLFAKYVSVLESIGLPLPMCKTLWTADLARLLQDMSLVRGPSIMGLLLVRKLIWCLGNETDQFGINIKSDEFGSKN